MALIAIIHHHKTTKDGWKLAHCKDGQRLISESAFFVISAYYLEWNTEKIRHVIIYYLEWNTEEKFNYRSRVLSLFSIPVLVHFPSCLGNV